MVSNLERCVAGHVPLQGAREQDRVEDTLLQPVGDGVEAVNLARAQEPGDVEEVRRRHAGPIGRDEDEVVLVGETSIVAGANLFE